VVTTSYPREPGDPAGGFVAGFARWLASDGWEVEVVAAGPGASRVDGLPVARVDGRGLFYAGGAPDALASGGARAWVRAASFQAALVRAVAARAAGWDAIVSHWLAPSAIAVEVACAGRARPHLAIAHSSDAWLLRRSKVGRAFVRRLARRADLVYAADHLVLDGAPGRIVPMGIDAAPGDRARGRRRFGLDPDGVPDVPDAPVRKDARMTALFLGRLVPIKRLDLVLEALPDDVDLIVAGDGPMRADWERRAPSRVRFLGEVRGADKGDLLAAADAFLFSSTALPDGRHEGAPTAIVEAMAAGLPVVAARGPGVDGLLRDGVDALVVEPTPAALRSALRRLADSPSLRRDLGERARRAAAVRDWSHVGPILAMKLVGWTARG